MRNRFRGSQKRDSKKRNSADILHELNQTSSTQNNSSLNPRAIFFPNLDNTSLQEVLERFEIVYEAIENGSYNV